MSKSRSTIEYNRYSEKVEVTASVPLIGHGNRTINEAVVNELYQAGIKVESHNTYGGMITIADLYHQFIHSSTVRAIGYSKNSENTRNSKSAELIKLQLRIFIKTMLKRYPNAKFFLTTQNIIGEEATKVELDGRKFSVILVLPDAFGKLNPLKKPTDKQKRAIYLVWNEQAFQVMKDKFDLDVHLIDLIDPIKGFPQLNQKQVEELELLEIEKRENLCLLKLSGSGGDPNLVIEIINALWKNSGIETLIFPGITHTKMNIQLRRWLKNIMKNKNTHVNYNLDEAVFYNVSRKIDHNTQLMLLNPSEQVLHSFVLSNLGKNPNIVWLPPTGNQEVLNLVHYIYIAQNQSLMTTVCIQKDFQKSLINKLSEFNLKQNIDYQLVEPENLSREHFNKAPKWIENQKHLNLEMAVKNIMDR